VVTVVWQLAVVQAIVPQVVAMVFAAIAGCDVVVAVGGSGRETRGCRVCRGGQGGV
jgi:hypothetical protein